MQKTLTAVQSLFLMLMVISMPSVTVAKTITVPVDAKSISAAIVMAAPGDTIEVDKGVYREHVMLPPGVALVAKETFKAIIDGRSKGTVVWLAKDNLVQGFEIRNGTFGVFSNGSGNSIRECRIIRNWQSGIVCVRHLPQIEDNIIAFNRASGIQGWDVRSTVASVNHNTIAFNTNHGIAIGGASSVVIENNLIVYNERYGLKTLPGAHEMRVTTNDFYGNLAAPLPVPEGNFAFDPALQAPRLKLDFVPDPRRCCTTKDASNDNLGARLLLVN